MTDESKPRRREADKLPPVPMMTKQAMDLGRSIRRGLTILTALTAILYVGLSGFVAWSWIQSNKNTDALCALYENSVRRAEAGAKFLTEHPNGVAGFSREQLQTSVNTSRATVRSLSGLACSVPKTLPTPAPFPTTR
jgi:hypothetical protein